ncbi:MAG: hypothetical protein O3A46_15655, partial [Candidatus Poribacteria bacterium]|nr:hypothetical protein [Candidatus Poribacteria bacterium]
MAHLSSEDKAFFKENGYLVVRGVIDPEDVQTAIDLIWDNLTNENVDRDDPSTWLDQKGGNVPNVGGDDFAKRLVNDTT